MSTTPPAATHTAPQVQARPAPLRSVSFSDGFWAQRQQILRSHTLPGQHDKLVETNRLQALDPTWRTGDRQSRHIFWDSDIAKWLEAASYSLATHPDTDLALRVADVVERVLALQEDDGYLNCWFRSVAPDERWTNLRDWHELYCAGHLMEAAVAHSEATGEDRLLRAMDKYAGYIATVFGREEGKKRGYPGHEEIELALVRLAEATGNGRHLDLARYFVDERGALEPHYYDTEAVTRGEEPGKWRFQTAGPYEYVQADKPVRQLERATGHAVRAMYLYSGMTDLVARGADGALGMAVDRLWDNVVHTQMYVTGSVGASGEGERFTTEYDLPEETSYCETCAAIGLVFWARRMADLYGIAEYADVMERALYNGVLSGLSLDGQRYFYVNPLASTGSHHRQDWFGCACCPPNVARLIASLGHYAYAEGSDAWVHLYAAGEAELDAGSTRLRLRVETDYPWSGQIRIEVTPDREVEAALNLRIPGWCSNATLRVNGKPEEEPLHEARSGKGYACLRRVWKDGDVVELDLDMPVERVYARPEVRMAAGKVALQRGPIVYCLEQVDNGTTSLASIGLPRGAGLHARHEPDLLGGITVVEATATNLVNEDWNDTELYRTHAPHAAACAIRAIPYAMWDNREPGQMLVWVREID
ncbi:MAG: glycoside hydrolase family 127 protein [Gemmatimonadetes bacterium]|nr:glycoside hydrolase family 127 protein [Gemmatimonadota bacterium]MBT6148494.1 glycoside hydrolase family 127 protein [Gemmatimonadota bacterium]MBT7861661.1 glycoside hydrolase family 127 protein [Gemmatimonadota bacterium]